MHSQPCSPSDSLIDPDDLDNNHSANTSVHDVLRERLHRRHLLKGGVNALTFAGLGGLSLSACGGNDDPAPTPSPTSTPTPLVSPTPVPGKSLGFSAVSKDVVDQLVLAPGYTASVIYATGDALSGTVGDYKNDGSDDTFSKRSGDHHDGMHYFGLAATGAAPDKTNTDRALLAMNHENIAGTVQFMHPAGQTNLSATSAAGRPEAEAIKEIEAHGVSIVEIKKTSGKFATVKASLLNRRITASTPMEINGPVRGSTLVKTKYSVGGTMTRGTLNNCASGYTPWGTYLTCEENWAGYFKRAATDDSNRSAKEIIAFKRVGLNQNNTGNNRWTSVVPADATSTEFSRWDASKLGASTDGTDDFRNAANTFGWVVEIDPYNTASTPRKRTALGRFAHEGAWPSLAVVGKPLAFYMGDDSRGEYIYKFVSNATWSTADATGGLAAGDKYLDNGTLYAAKFNADGTGTWLKLDISNTAIASAAAYAFADQADVLVNARLAADAAGATKMDRPEWTAVNPANGEVYITCTENPDRANLGAVNGNNNPNPAADTANPRYWLDKRNGTSNQRGNVNGHIMRVRETGNDTSATTFDWDIFLFGAQAKADAGLDDVHYQKNVNLSGLSDFNDLSKPDGCWFSPTSGILWIQTDDNTYTDVSNCMLLAAMAGSVGDGGEINIVNKADGSSAATPPAGDVTIKTRIGKKLGDTQLRRFLTAPRGAEVTGLAESPDGKALFINIQHPGENTTAAMFTAGTFESNWPGNGKGVAAYGPGGATARPRSATVMITKDDGGIIGL